MRRHVRLPLLLLASALCVTVLSAASLPQAGTAALSAFLEAATARGDVPGVVVAVVNADGVVYHEAFGRSSTLRNAPMAKDTIFNMASMTKPITSVAIMMLVDQGTTPRTPATGRVQPDGRSPSGTC
jgi:CubicO group peptidase (beta-lactamase class C family)